MRVGDGPEAVASVRAGRPSPRSQAPLSSKAAPGLRYCKPQLQSTRVLLREDDCSGERGEESPLGEAGDALMSARCCQTVPRQRRPHVATADGRCLELPQGISASTRPMPMRPRRRPMPYPCHATTTATRRCDCYHAALIVRALCLCLLESRS
jgi:hypothetical protein